jgi:hypothetical protein
VEYLEMETMSCECGGSGQCHIIEQSFQRIADFHLADEESKVEFIQGYSEAQDELIPGTLGEVDTIRVHKADFASSSSPTSAAQLAEDCHRLASLSKETFWIDQYATPRCSLEAVAQQVMKYHMQLHGLDGQHYRTLGAEYWCQVKDQDDTEDNIASGVDIHYDKDEFLSEKLEIGVFPAVSTVTYLTAPSGSAATAVFMNKISDTVGAGMRGCLLSYPHVGKHISFDGRYLHGAPAALNKPVFDYHTKKSGNGGGGSKGGQGKQSNSSNKRVTFLVNVWIRHRPLEALCLSQEQVDAINSVRGSSSDTYNGDGCAVIALSPLDASSGACTSIEVQEAQCRPPSEGGSGEIVQIRVPFLGSDEEVAWGYEKGDKGKEGGDDGTGGKEKEGEDEQEEDEEEEDEEEEDLSVFMWLPVARIASALSVGEATNDGSGDGSGDGDGSSSSTGIENTTFFLSYDTEKIAPLLA